MALEHHSIGDTTKYDVVLGDHSTTVHDVGQQVPNSVVEIIAHDGYNVANGSRYDIALVKFSHSPLHNAIVSIQVRLKNPALTRISTMNIQPICPPLERHSGMFDEQTMCMTAGWGNIGGYKVTH